MSRRPVPPRARTSYQAGCSPLNSDVGGTSSHRPVVRMAERDAAGVEVDGVLRCQARGGASLALPLVRRAVVPHVLVDHELVAALEQVQETGPGRRARRPRTVRRSPPSGSGGGPRDGVALVGGGASRGPGARPGRPARCQVNDGRAAGQRAGRDRRAWSSCVLPWSLGVGSTTVTRNRPATGPELIAAEAVAGSAPGLRSRTRQGALGQTDPVVRPLSQAAPTSEPAEQGHCRRYQAGSDDVGRWPPPR